MRVIHHLDCSSPRHRPAPYLPPRKLVPHLDSIPQHCVMNRSHSILTGQLFVVFGPLTLSAFVLLKELVPGEKEPILVNRRVRSAGKVLRSSAAAVRKRQRLDAEEERRLAGGRPFLGR